MNRKPLDLSLNKKRWITIISLSVILLILAISSIFIGSSGMSFVDGIKALFRNGDEVNQVIIYNVRLPRIIAAILAGTALALSGTIMQTMSNNIMASPSTLGVSNAAVLGANIAIIILGGGTIVINGGNVNITNPYFVSGFAFVFALLSTILILFLGKFKKYNKATVVLIGITLGTFFTGVTTLLQYFATDTALQTAVYWSFGDLGRASYEDNLIILVVTVVSLIYFLIFSYKYNAMLLGDDNASTLGINLKIFKFVSLLLASLLTAVVVSLLGIIGFVGLLAPHIMRKLLGNNHKYLLISSSLFGSCILLFSDMIARTILSGISLPVGAVTSLIGAPIFVFILLFGRKEK